MLKFGLRGTETEGVDTRLILLLHGRGADHRDMFSLAGHMPGDAVVIAPEAQFPAAPWGYGPGWAWYQFLGRNRPEPDSFSQSLQSLEELLQHLNKDGKYKQIIMGGFSQGGTISLAYALSHPNEIDVVLNFSGFLADHPSLSPMPPAARATMPRIWWGHGTQDPAIPFALAVEGRAQLQQAGYHVEARDYDIGHWIADDELADALAWLERNTR